MLQPRNRLWNVLDYKQITVDMCCGYGDVFYDETVLNAEAEDHDRATFPTNCSSYKER